MCVTNDTIPIPEPRRWCWPAVIGICAVALLLGAAIVSSWQTARAAKTSLDECMAARADVAKVVASCSALAGAKQAECDELRAAVGRLPQHCPPVVAPRAKVPEFKIEDF